MIGGWDGGEQLSLADTEFTLLQFWLKMGCHVAHQGHVTDHQHQGQYGNSYPCGLAHGFILKQFFGIDVND
jgi:hypothetical protein